MPGGSTTHLGLTLRRPPQKPLKYSIRSYRLYRHIDISGLSTLRGQQGAEKLSAKRPSSTPCSLLNSLQGALLQFRALITSTTIINPAPNSTAEAGEGEGTRPARQAPTAALHGTAPAWEAAREKLSEETGAGPAQGADPRRARKAAPLGR